MAARDNESDELARRRANSNKVGGEMSLQMIHSNQGNLKLIRQRLGKRKTHQKGPHQAGSPRDGNEINIGLGDLRFLKRQLKNPINLFEAMS